MGFHGDFMGKSSINVGFHGISVGFHGKIIKKFGISWENHL